MSEVGKSAQHLHLCPITQVVVVKVKLLQRLKSAIRKLAKAGEIVPMKLEDGQAGHIASEKQNLAPCVARVEHPAQNQVFEARISERERLAGHWDQIGGEVQHLQVKLDCQL